MPATVLPGPAESPPIGRGGIPFSVTVVLAVWFALVVSFGAFDAFVGPPGTPPIAIGVGFGAPLLLFFAGLRLSQSFRDFVRSLDLRLIAGMQAWRWGGLGFLSLYAHGVLPAMFALPAGLGDMAVGLVAPWMVLGLVRHPRFASSPAFIRWNVFGVLDLIVAVSLGALSATLSTATPGEITTAPMATLPLLMIPAFFVPLFLMLHTSALMQSRQAIRGRA
ncbi:MAG: hypothetical protein ACREUG_07125 [Steroidobacteraceae bacterium]